MADYGDYFDEDSIPEEKLKFRWPEITDTNGEIVKRPGPTVFQRVLDNPLPVTSQSKADYALLWCERVGVGIVREGAKICEARFLLVSLEKHRVCYSGVAGRTKAIQRFIRMVKKGSSSGLE